MSNITHEGVEIPLRLREIFLNIVTLYDYVEESNTFILGKRDVDEASDDNDIEANEWHTCVSWELDGYSYIDGDGFYLTENDDGDLVDYAGIEHEEAKLLPSVSIEDAKRVSKIIRDLGNTLPPASLWTPDVAADADNHPMHAFLNP